MYSVVLLASIEGGWFWLFRFRNRRLGTVTPKVSRKGAKELMDVITRGLQLLVRVSSVDWRIQAAVVE